MSGSKEYFALVTVILLQLASYLSGQVKLDLTEVTKSKCSEDGWSLIDSETIANPARLIPAKLLKASSFSCASFQINLTTSGSLDISVYVDSSSAHSGLVILVDDGVNGPLTTYEYRMSNEDFEQGWHTVSLPIKKRLNAEVTLLGFSDGEDIVLIDSIKYNKKIKKSLHWAKPYAETKIIDLLIVGDQDNDQNSMSQEKPILKDKKQSYKNYSNLSTVSLKHKSGEIQLIEVGKFAFTENNEDNYFENSMNEQFVYENTSHSNTMRSVSAVEDDNDEDGKIEGRNIIDIDKYENFNGRKDNKEDQNIADGKKVKNQNEDTDTDEDVNEGNSDGEDGNEEKEEGSEGGGNSNEENENGEDSSKNGNGEDGNGVGGNGENGNGESDGEDGNGDGEAGNGEDNSENGSGEEDGNGEGGSGEEEDEEVSQPDTEQEGNTSFWNTWTLLLVSVGSATALALVLAAAYHVGKIRGKEIPPPIYLSDLEAPRIIPRVTGIRPVYDRFGGSEYGSSSPELFAR